MRAQAVAIGLVNHIVSDQDLSARSEAEIVEYKRRHRDLFTELSADIREMIRQIQEVPYTAEFTVALRDLALTSRWRRQQATQRAIRAAWDSFFKTSARAAVTGMIGLGMAPTLPLSTLVTLAASASGAWLVPELVDLAKAIRGAKAHGLYYLMNL